MGRMNCIYYSYLQELVLRFLSVLVYFPNTCIYGEFILIYSYWKTVVNHKCFFSISCVCQRYVYKKAVMFLPVLHLGLFPLLSKDGLFIPVTLFCRCSIWIQLEVPTAPCEFTPPPSALPFILSGFYWQWLDQEVLGCEQWGSQSSWDGTWRFLFLFFLQFVLSL